MLLSCIDLSNILASGLCATVISFATPSGAAIYVSGKTADLNSGVRKAEEVIDSGKALSKLRAFIEFAA